MKVVAFEYFSVSVKHWFKKKRFYLRLELFSDGSWHLNINPSYQADLVTWGDWKRIRSQCKAEIINRQRSVISIQYKSQKHTTSYYRDPKTLEVTASECYNIIDHSYKDLFKDKK